MKSGLSGDFSWINRHVARNLKSGGFGNDFLMWCTPYACHHSVTVCGHHLAAWKGNPPARASKQYPKATHN